MCPDPTIPGFRVSAYVAALHSPASPPAVKAEVAKLLAILGEEDPGVAVELSATPINLSVLAELMLWNQRLAPHPARDRIGRAACLFWAVQTLVTTVMRSAVLDLGAKYSPGVQHAMGRGADGLFAFGQSQFEALAILANEIVGWLLARRYASVAFIESPIGNTFPTQVLSDLAGQQGLHASIVQWNVPRNDRSSRGRTIKDAAASWVNAIRDFDCVVFLDEVLSGSRYSKLFGALCKHIDQKKLLAVGMVFGDSSRPTLATGERRKTLVERLNAQGLLMGFPQPVRDFPPLRLFKMDAGNDCKWERPVIWGDSDLIVGKRKVNLIFMILDHCLGLLEDLAKGKSEFRPYLVRAWSQNTQGQSFAFTPHVVQSLFRRIVTELPFDEFRDVLWESAKARFPADYVGDVGAIGKVGAEERWKWFRDTFLVEATKRGARGLDSVECHRNIANQLAEPHIERTDRIVKRQRIRRGIQVASGGRLEVVERASKGSIDCEMPSHCGAWPGLAF
jgi:hypothetical protein